MARRAARWSPAPSPRGPRASPNGFCLELTEAQAIAAGATWGGPGTTCADADNNNNGIDDACEGDDCPADLTGEGDVNTNDFFQFLVVLPGVRTTRADFEPGGGINTNDFFAFLAAYQAGMLSPSRRRSLTDPAERTAPFLGSLEGGGTRHASCGS